MTKITDLFQIESEQLNDSIEFSKFFLERIREFPGKKIGILGKAQSGLTTCSQYLKSLKDTGVNGKNIALFADTRGVPDTIIGSLSNIDDLKNIIKEQIPDWYSMFEQQNIIFDQEFKPDPAFASQAINKVINEPIDSRKMLKWRAALAIWCLRDLRYASESQDSERVEFYELPYLPIDYNQYFDKLILVERRPNWFSDPAFQAHFNSEGLDMITETGLVAVRDQEFDDYKNTINWRFDHTILNDGTVEELNAKLLNVVKEIV